MSLECIRYKEISKGKLSGFADIYVPKWGAEICGCSHFKDGNREWVNMPSREYVKPDGEKAYAMIVRFKEKEHANAFASACLEAIRNRPKEQDQAPQQQSNEVPF